MKEPFSPLNRGSNQASNRSAPTGNADLREGGFKSPPLAFLTPDRSAESLSKRGRLIARGMESNIRIGMKPRNTGPGMPVIKFPAEDRCARQANLGIWIAISYQNRKFTIKQPQRLRSKMEPDANGSATIGHPKSAEAAAVENLLTKEELRQRLNLPSTRGVDELVRRRAIPVIVLGHRTRRFSYAAVQAAIEKLTIKAV